MRHICDGNSKQHCLVFKSLDTHRIIEVTGIDAVDGEEHPAPEICAAEKLFVHIDVAGPLGLALNLLGETPGKAVFDSHHPQVIPHAIGDVQ